MTSDFELDQFIPYRLSVLTNTVSLGISRTYLDRFDIGVTEWRIMAVVGRYPELTASEIMSRTAMDKVPISRGVKTLMAKGLLERRTDTEDRRCRRHSLSSRGLDIYKDIIPRAQNYEGELLDVLTGEERRLMDEVLSKLHARARTLNKDC